MANQYNSPNLMAAYRMESGALTADSAGSNTLTAAGTPTASGTCKEGAASVEIQRAGGDALSIANADMAAGFPLATGKDATDDLAMTLCFWYRCTAYVALQTRWCVIWRNDADADIYHGIQLTTISMGIPYFRRCINGNGLDLGDATCPLDQWVFVAYRMRNTDGTHLDCELDVWNDTSQSWVYSGNWLDYAGQVALTAGRFEIGAGSDGLYDEVLLFNTYLDDATIVLIKDGAYSSSSSSSSESWSSESSSSLSSSSSYSSSSSFVPLDWPTLSRAYDLEIRELPADRDIAARMGAGRDKVRAKFTRKRRRWQVAIRLMALADLLTLERFYLVDCRRSVKTFTVTHPKMDQRWLVRFDPAAPPRFRTEQRLAEKHAFEATFLEDTAGTYGPGEYGHWYFPSG